jgi:hypothetical protein
MAGSEERASMQEFVILNAALRPALGQCKLLIPSQLQQYKEPIFKAVNTVARVMDLADDFKTGFEAMSKAASESLSNLLKNAAQEDYLELCKNIRAELTRRHVNALKGNNLQERKARAVELVRKFMHALHSRTSRE